MTHWSVEVDLQLLRPGLARRPPVASLPQHSLRASGIAHQHHRERQAELHHNRRSPCRTWARPERSGLKFLHRGHHRLAHRLTSSGVTTGWMPWAF
ncbi:MAG: hypothetical protein QM522_12365, partial [Chitinophagaceae bacterium]|nr:hypothetical protein [Chitinophagaceae bacterium]